MRCPPLALLLVAVAVAGCFDPRYDDPTCSAGGECPEGWYCAGGPMKACIAEGDLPPADVTADADISQTVPADGAIDAPIDAPVDAVVDAAAAPVEPDAAAASCTERAWIPVLANGGFEDGRVVWTRSPENIEVIFPRGPQLPVTPEAGTWAGYLGGHNSRRQVLAQPIALPATTNRVRFRAARCIATLEVEPQIFDVMTVDIVQPNTDVVVGFTPWTNRNGFAECQWSYVDEVRDVADPTAGATFRIVSTLDGGKVTTFYLDSLSLDAFACPDPP
jgi:hypothetical protein